MAKIMILFFLLSCNKIEEYSREKTCYTIKCRIGMGNIGRYFFCVDPMPVHPDPLPEIALRIWGFTNTIEVSREELVSYEIGDTYCK